MTSSKSRAGVLRVMWRVLTQHRSGGPGLRTRFRCIPRMVGATLTGRYRGMGRARLAGLVAAAIYLVSPVDLVPEAFLGLIGLVDDLALAVWLVSTLLVQTDQYLEWEGSQPGAVGQRSSSGAV